MPESKEIYFAIQEFSLCELYIACSSKGVCRIDFKNNEEGFFNWIKNNYTNCTIIYDKGKLERPIKELEEYFNKTRTQFDVELDIIGSEFQKRIWRQFIGIPYGKTVSYKYIAESVGGSGYSRAVGNAANKNPIPIIIPCHRVVGTDGGLTGFAAGLNIKKELLDLEKQI